MEEDSSKNIEAAETEDSANPDWWEYYVYTSRQQFCGSDVYEIYPGDFEEDIKWWNEGSVYIREEGFEPFVGVFRQAVPEIDFYSETKIVQPQLGLLISDMTELYQVIADALTPDDLKRATGRYVQVNISNFVMQKDKIMNMAKAIQDVLRKAVDSGGCLWFLGV